MKNKKKFYEKTIKASNKIAKRIKREQTYHIIDIPNDSTRLDMNDPIFRKFISDEMLNESRLSSNC